VSQEEADQADQVATMMSLIYKGLASWLAIGVPEVEVRGVWEKSADTLLGPYEGKSSMPHSQRTSVRHPQKK